VKKDNRKETRQTRPTRQTRYEEDVVGRHEVQTTPDRLTEPDKSARLDTRRFSDEHLEIGVGRLDRWVLGLDELTVACERGSFTPHNGSHVICHMR
jgi:hypothetical protein